MARPPGILPSGCAGGLRGFPMAHPCTGGKLARIHAGHPADFPPPTRRAIGAPKSSALLRAEAKRRHIAPIEFDVHIAHLAAITHINLVSFDMHRNMPHPAPPS